MDKNICTPLIPHEKPDFMFMSDVQPNTDTYTWQELNCFYRPFSIALKSFDVRFFQLFLMFSAMHVTYLLGSLKFDEVKSGFDFFNFYDSNLMNVFKAEIKEVRFQTEHEMHELLRQNLCDNRIIVLPTDLYSFPYINHYKELHHKHFIMVKGYNTKKDLYYILDNQHVDMGFSTKYCDFMLDSQTIYAMLSSYAQIAEPNLDYKYFWTVEETSEFHQDALFLCVELMKKLLSYFTKHKIKKQCVEKMMLDELKLEKFQRTLVDDIRTNSMRVVYFDSLRYFLQMVDESNPELYTLDLKISSTYTSWDELKNKIVYHYQKQDSNTIELEKLLDRTLELDSKLMLDVLSFLNRSNVGINEMNSKPYIIKNNHNAQLIIQSNLVYMNLSKDCFYDTWTYNDDACQILYPLKTSDFTLEMSLSVDAVFGGSLLAGFIFKYEYNYKIMFGNYRNIQIGLFAPNEANTDLVKVNYDVEGIRYYKVQCINNLYNFYVRRNKQENWYQVYTRLDTNQIKYIGLFAKTWENCKTHVMFQDLLLDGQPLIL